MTIDLVATGAGYAMMASGPIYALRARLRLRVADDIGAGLRGAFADTATATIPADQQNLLDQLR